VLFSFLFTFTFSTCAHPSGLTRSSQRKRKSEFLLVDEIQHWPTGALLRCEGGLIAMFSSIIALFYKRFVFIGSLVYRFGQFLSEHDAARAGQAGSFFAGHFVLRLSQGGATQLSCHQLPRGFEAPAQAGRLCERGCHTSFSGVPCHIAATGLVEGRTDHLGTVVHTVPTIGSARPSEKQCCGPPILPCADRPQVRVLICFNYY
jgi:hypothetical protein